MQYKSVANRVTKSSSLYIPVTQLTIKFSLGTEFQNSAESSAFSSEKTAFSLALSWKSRYIPLFLAHTHAYSWPICHTRISRGEICICQNFAPTKVRIKEPIKILCIAKWRSINRRWARERERERAREKFLAYRERLKKRARAGELGYI